MLSFGCDYAQGADEHILQRLSEINRTAFSGYGCDEICESAKEKIRTACACPDADVFFITGGTQANQIVIDSLLRNYEAAVCADTGHINSHEGGALEFTGHKIYALPNQDGKLDAAALKHYLDLFYESGHNSHMAQPGLVYITHPTELGTLYTKAELTELSRVCHSFGLPLYLDGARMAYGLAAKGTDVTLADIAQLCDAFYIGGTKCGAMFGEAVVFPRHGAPKAFFTSIKQHGGLLAKGWMMGVQFDELFTDDLYYKLGRKAMDAADTLRAALTEKGYRMFSNSCTNQLFVILDEDTAKKWAESVNYSVWERYDESHLIIRLVTCWATEPEDVQGLIALL